MLFGKFDKAVQLAPHIHKILFSGKRSLSSKSKGEIPFKAFANGACFALDVGEFRFITQNPYKSSKWGLLAREGKQISWLIHQPTNRWIARVVEGEVELLINQEVSS